MRFLLIFVVFGLFAFKAASGTNVSAPAADASSKTPPVSPPPTLADVPYGDHPRQKLDFYKAPSDKPTPVVLLMHGGAWIQGDKKLYAGKVGKYLAAGISVVAFNYRYVSQAKKAGVQPPVEWPMHDAARVLQFTRSKASEWNIDKTRVGLSGSSAGACTSLWIAFHPDLADPKSSDPVARESTRVTAAAVNRAQTSLDPKQMQEWIPNSRYGKHAFGLEGGKSNFPTREASFADFIQHRDEVLPWIREYSPYEQATADDPAIYLIYDAPPTDGKPDVNPTHSANFGVKLKEKLDALGVPAELVYPGAPDVKHPGVEEFLIEQLVK